MRPDRTLEAVSCMVCTAGHVDHGKTELVKMLTGCSTDRLKAEVERGMTIELGFAPCRLDDGRTIGIVDVPGHERFVRTMVAGVSGISAAVLVIAADDGVMPQTVEHLQILDLLGIDRGVVALTKSDLVPAGTLDERAARIAGLLATGPLAGAPICPVSSRTFEGRTRLLAELSRTLAATQPGGHAGVFRLPVERSFSLKGMGLVVTGIPVDGSIGVGDTVEVMPGRQRGTVRRIQSFLREASSGRRGQCLALNVPDLGRRPPQRGDVIGLPDHLRPSRVVHVDVRSVEPCDRPLRNAEPVSFHTGTAEEHGKIYLLERPALDPGEAQLATIVLDGPVVAAVADRFVIRRPSPPATVAGGVIVRLTPGDRRPRRAAALEELTAHRAFFAGAGGVGKAPPELRIEHLLEVDTPDGATAREISRETLLAGDLVGRCLPEMVVAGTLLRLGPSRYLLERVYRQRFAEVESRVRQACGDSSVQVVALTDLRRGLDWPDELWERVLTDLERAGLVAVRGPRLTVRPGDGPDPDRALAERVVELYETTGFRSPRPDELAELLGEPQTRLDRIVEYLCAEGRLARLTPAVILSTAHLKRAQDLVVDIIKKAGKLDSAGFKTVIASTRKYALAILDHLDSLRVTVRTGNDRTLAADHERHLLR